MDWLIHLTTPLLALVAAFAGLMRWSLGPRLQHMAEKIADAKTAHLKQDMEDLAVELSRVRALADAATAKIAGEIPHLSRAIEELSLSIRDLRKEQGEQGKEVAAALAVLTERRSGRDRRRS